MTRMPYTRKWQQMLATFYGAPTANQLISKAQTYYEQFCSQHASENNHNRRTNLKRQILPGLSIYKALREENNNLEKVLGEVEALFMKTFFAGRLPGIRLLNYLPNLFLIIGPALKRMTANEYTPDSQEIIADSADCFAINIYRCFILDTLTMHNARELTPLYCKTDDWLAEALPKVSWQRTKTLGRGNDCCDFRWCRIK